MNTLALNRSFQPQAPDAAGVNSWVHPGDLLGDLHMTRASDENNLKLAESVNEIDQAFADSASGDLTERERLERDQDNALGPWPERGLLGTQLGPKKNGKKW